MHLIFAGNSTVHFIYVIFIVFTTTYEVNENWWVQHGS